MSNNSSVPSTPRGKKSPVLVMQSSKHFSHLEMSPLPSKASSTQLSQVHSFLINIPLKFIYIFTNYSNTILSHLDKWLLKKLLKISISPLKKKKLCIYFMWMIICLHMSMYHCIPGACGGQKRVLDGLRIEFQRVVSCCMYVCELCGY